MDAWIGVVGTLLGVTLGGIVSLLTNRQRIKQEKQIALNKIKIDKIEDAHELLTNIGVRYRKYLARDVSFLSTGKERDDEQEGRMPFEELDMLFSFYVPSLALKAREIIESCQEYGSLSIKARIFTPNSEAEKNELTGNLMKSHQDLTSKISELKKQLAQAFQTHLE
jgi:hypothetical protein